MVHPGLSRIHPDSSRIQPQPAKQTCHFCGHTGTDVKAYAYIHIGGRGEMGFPVCDNALECIARVEQAKDEKEK